MTSVQQDGSRNAGIVAAGREVDEAWDHRRQQLHADGVRYCLSAYVDVHGVPKAKAVPIDHFARMMRGSELFTGAAIDGLGQTPGRRRALAAARPRRGHGPARGSRPSRGRPAISTCTASRTRCAAATVLQRQIDRAAEHGLQFNLGIETEFFLVQPRRRPGSARPTQGRARRARPTTSPACSTTLPFLDELIGYMNQLGWDVHSFDHEDANSQFELDFAYTDVISMADRFVLWRMMTKLARAPARLRGDVHAQAATATGPATAATSTCRCRPRDRREPVRRPSDDRARRGRVAARLPVHRRRARARTRDQRGRPLPDGQLVQAAHQDRLDDRLHVGAGLHLLRAQQPHAHAADPDGRRRVESRAVDTSCNPYLAAAMFARGRPRGHRERPRPRRPDPRSTCTSRATRSSPRWVSRSSRGRCSRPSRRSTATRWRTGARAGAEGSPSSSSRPRSGGTTTTRSRSGSTTATSTSSRPDGWSWTGRGARSRRSSSTRSTASAGTSGRFAAARR